MDDFEGYEGEEDSRDDSDVRRCAYHGTIISSPCGMFDGVCGPCESAADAD